MPGKPLITIFHGRSRGLGSTAAAQDIYFNIYAEFINHLDKISGSALKVLIVLSACMSPEGWSFPGIPFIREKTGLNKETIAKALTELCTITIDGGRLLLAIQEKEPGGLWKHNRYLIFPTPEDLIQYAPVTRRARPNPGPKGKKAPETPPPAETPEEGRYPGFPDTVKPDTVEPDTENTALNYIHSLTKSNEANASLPPDGGGEALSPPPAPEEKQPPIIKDIDNPPPPPPAPLVIIPDPLLPDTEMGYYLFNKLGDDYRAKHRRPPVRFQSLAQKQAWAMYEDTTPPADIKSAIDAALLVPILALGRIIPYVKGYKPRPPGSNGNGYNRAAAPAQPAPLSKEATDKWQSDYENNKRTAQAKRLSLLQEELASNEGLARLLAVPDRELDAKIENLKTKIAGLEATLNPQTLQTSGG